jgi:hypothetical protein
MSEQVIEDVDDLGQPTAEGELVHWMAPRPMRVGPAGVSATAAGAFALGVGAAVIALALMHWLGPQRTMEPARHRWF